jgi:hypothetical protein
VSIYPDRTVIREEFRWVEEFHPSSMYEFASNGTCRLAIRVDRRAGLNAPQISALSKIHRSHREMVKYAFTRGRSLETAELTVETAEDLEEVDLDLKEDGSEGVCVY